MSASEKLKALGEMMRRNVTLDDGFVRREAREAYADALPQIVAVVEALEDATGMASARNPEAYKQWFFGQRQVALNALDEALS